MHDEAPGLEAFNDYRLRQAVRLPPGQGQPIPVSPALQPAAVVAQEASPRFGGGGIFQPRASRDVPVAGTGGGGAQSGPVPAGGRSATARGRQGDEQGDGEQPECDPAPDSVRLLGHGASSTARDARLSTGPGHAQVSTRLGVAGAATAAR